MKTSLLHLVSAIAIGTFSTSAGAVICLAKNVQTPAKHYYLANNCQYFSGSKALRLNRTGALFNYNNRGDYNDQLHGSSFIYCPISADSVDAGHNVSAEIKVTDLNKEHDVICQMGKSSYTNKGFAAYWGETTKSSSVGEQTLKTVSRNASDVITMPNSFITCSLPPQDREDQKASSLVAYTVNARPFNL